VPIRTALWKVGLQPQPLSETALGKEQLLEDMIVAAPLLLSDEWMIIGRQEDTGFGGRIDLISLAPDGSLVVIEQRCRVKRRYMKLVCLELRTSTNAARRVLSPVADTAPQEHNEMQKNLRKTCR
jgi:hypothetical protein